VRAAIVHTRVCEVLGIEHPVLSAGVPIIGLDLVAAVSNAGGLGILGATYLGPGEILEVVATLRRRTARPFALNLLVPFCTTAQLEACIDARVPGFRRRGGRRTMPRGAPGSLGSRWPTW
jgi:NAD(P)H-dependent flavin oxidoreductase YrpB (nitropropane dioxygenase family)